MIPTKIIDNTNGGEFWRLPTGGLHRKDGPAVVYPDGFKAWYINDIRHREDGPAVIWPDGLLWWYLQDTRYEFSVFREILRSQYGKTDEDIMMLTMQYSTSYHTAG